MVFEFIRKQIVFNGRFFIGKSRWKRFLILITIGTVFQLFTNSIISSIGISNAIVKNAVSGIMWFIISFVIINFLVRIAQNQLDYPLILKLFRTGNFFLSVKTQRDIFKPLIADWQEEYFEALFKKEIWKSRWINVRYTYAFLMAMWMKSPIGDLIEFIRKFAK